MSDAPPPALTYEQRRSRRKRAVRARTIDVKRMTKREFEMSRILQPEDALTKLLRSERPRTRGECAGGQRPCPWVSCRYHLYLDVQPRTGAIKLNLPDIEVEDMKESCVLDVAEREGITFEEVGTFINLTRERIRQLEVSTVAKIQALRETERLRDFIDEEPSDKRHLPILRRER